MFKIPAFIESKIPHYVVGKVDGSHIGVCVGYFNDPEKAKVCAEKHPDCILIDVKGTIDRYNK